MSYYALPATQYTLRNVTKGTSVTVAYNESRDIFLAVGDSFTVSGSGFSPGGTVGVQSLGSGAWVTIMSFLVSANGTFQSIPIPVQSDVGVSQPTRAAQPPELPPGQPGPQIISGTINLMNAETSPSGWPYAVTLTLFNNYSLKSEAWQTTGVNKDSAPFKIGDADKFLGAKVVYTILCRDGRMGLLGGDAGLDVNHQMAVHEEGFQVGSVASGETDIGTLLASEGNVVTIGQGNSIGNWNEFTYTVKVVLGYTSKPTVPPSVDDNWWSNLEWWQWGLVGGGILVALYLVGGKGGSTMVVYGPPPQRAKK